MSIVYRNGKFKGIGSVAAFAKFEEALIKHCERKDRKVPQPKVSIIVKPRLRDVINIVSSKNS